LSAIHAGRVSLDRLSVGEWARWGQRAHESTDRPRWSITDARALPSAAETQLASARAEITRTQDLHDESAAALRGIREILAGRERDDQAAVAFSARGAIRAATVTPLSGQRLASAFDVIRKNRARQIGRRAAHEHRQRLNVLPQLFGDAQRGEAFRPVR
jgi:hypothetical protein